MRMVMVKRDNKIAEMTKKFVQEVEELRAKTMADLDEYLADIDDNMTSTKRHMENHYEF